MFAHLGVLLCLCSCDMACVSLVLSFLVSVEARKLQQLVVVCGTHFLSTCKIQTSPMDCSDDG